MMRSLTLQSQGPWECLPTSVAMLADMPLDDVLDLWQHHDPEHRTFQTLMEDCVSGFWGAALDCIASLFTQEAANHYAAAIGFCAYIGNAPGGLWATKGKGEEQAFPPTGRGILQLIRGQQRHAVAYCDGLVYDPGELRPMSWEEYHSINDLWRIEAVIPTEGLERR